MRHGLCKAGDDRRLDLGQVPHERRARHDCGVCAIRQERHNSRDERVDEVRCRLQTSRFGNKSENASVYSPRSPKLEHCMMQTGLAPQ